MAKQKRNPKKVQAKGRTLDRPEMVQMLLSQEDAICEIYDCNKPVDGIGRLCKHHKQKYQQNGSIYGPKPIRTELVPIIKIIREYYSETKMVTPGGARIFNADLNRAINSHMHRPEGFTMSAFEFEARCNRASVCRLDRTGRGEVMLAHWHWMAGRTYMEPILLYMAARMWAEINLPICHVLKDNANTQRDHMAHIICGQLVTSGCGLKYSKFTKKLTDEGWVTTRTPKVFNSFTNKKGVGMCVQRTVEELFGKFWFREGALLARVQNHLGFHVECDALLSPEHYKNPMDDFVVEAPNGYQSMRNFK